MATILRVQGLCFRYPDGTEALRGVDFRLGVGESVALLGANGSGKSTFVRHVNGILQGTGLVQVCGMVLRDQTLREIRRKVGLVFQDPDDQLFMPTIIEDVAFAPLAGGASREAAEAAGREALDQVGFTGDLSRPPHLLSSGEKRKVAIAGVLAQKPEILMLDEPETFLDPPGQRALADLLRKLPQSKLLVTHSVDFAEAVTTRAVFFEQGRITAEGSVSSLTNRYQWRGF